jgi:hypothetical protein
MFHLAYIGPISSGATGTGRQIDGELGTGAHFDEVPALAQPELLFVCQPVAFGSLRSLLLQLLTSFLIPDFLDLRPFFNRHSPLDPALLGCFLLLRGPSLALPFCHAFPLELGQIPSEDALMTRLPKAFLLILFAQQPLVRSGQVGLSNSRIAGKDQHRERHRNKNDRAAHCPTSISIHDTKR